MPRLVNLSERSHEDITFGFYFTQDDMSYGMSWRTLKRQGSFCLRKDVEIDWYAFEDAAVGVHNNELISRVRSRDKKEIVSFFKNMKPRAINGTVVSGVFQQTDLGYVQIGDRSYLAFGFSTSCEEKDLCLQILNIGSDKALCLLSLSMIHRVQKKEGLYKIGKPVQLSGRSSISFGVQLTDVPPEELTVVMGGLLTRDVL